MEVRVNIRPQSAAEDRDIDAVHQFAFGAHGAKVVELLRVLREDTADDERLSLVATEDEAVVGHVLFTPSLLDSPAALVDVRVLSPIAVRPDRQGRGIGSALIRTGLELLDRIGVPLVSLEGPPEYYSRVGFTAAGPLGFRKPSLRIPDEAFQVAQLRSYEPTMTGTLVYSHAFWRADAGGLRDE